MMRLAICWIRMEPVAIGPCLKIYSQEKVGVFLETAHPAKFLHTVEDIIGTDINIPEKLKAFMNGTNSLFQMSKKLYDLCKRNWLMKTIA
mgnify:CR=1 FL=1